MADLDRIKRNVAKMATMNVPMEVIDGYIASEGVSVEDVRNHMLGTQQAGGQQAMPKGDMGTPDQTDLAPWTKFQSNESVTPDPYRTYAQRLAEQFQSQGVDVAASYPARVLHGATAGFSDEMLAGALTPLEMIRQGTWNPAEGYRYAKAQQDLALEEADKK